MALRWFCIQTKAHQEIRASVCVAMQGFPTFVPLRSDFRREGNMLVPVKRDYRVDGRTVSITGRLLFPRYIFASFDVEKPEWGAIDNTRGVSRILRNAGNKPEPIPDRVIEALHRRHEQREVKPRRIRFRFFVGDEVSIELDRVGTVIGRVLDISRGRVFVLVGVRIINVKERDLAVVKKVGNAARVMG